MQIGIDMSLTSMAKTGLASYATSLVAAMAEVDRENEFILFPYAWHSFPPNYENAFCPTPTNFRLAGSRLPKSWVSKMWDAPGADRGKIMGFKNPDVYFSPFHSTPEQHFRRLVSVFHDVAFRVHPEFSTDENRLHCELQFERARRMADIMVTVSHYSKAEMVKHMGVPADWIRVTHEAADPRYRPLRNARFPKRIAKDIGTVQDFILYVGSVEPRKNLRTLFEAYDALRQRNSATMPLVIAGGTGWKNSEIYAEVERRGLQNKVLFTGYVSDKEILHLYNKATVFVYPTIYEGFGLPVIEAMSCGTPVITTRVASIPEVGGEAVSYVDDPLDAETLSQRLEELLSEPQRRDELRAAGLAQASRFSWQRCARETIEVFKEVHENPQYARTQLTMGQDERALGVGWHAQEMQGDKPFRWCERNASLYLTSLDRRTLTIEASTSFPGEEQVLAVRVSGQTIGRMPLGLEWKEGVYDLPAGLPKDAELDIRLDVNFDLPPASKGGDQRQLGAKISKVVLG